MTRSTPTQPPTHADPHGHPHPYPPYGRTPVRRPRYRRGGHSAPWSTRAKVNLAAVHYHFGNREQLVRPVIKRRALPMNAELPRWLDEVEAAAAGAPAIRPTSCGRSWRGLRAGRRASAPGPAIGPHRRHARRKAAHVLLFALRRAGVLASLRRRAVQGRAERAGGPRRSGRLRNSTWGAMLFTMAKRTDREVTAGGQIEPLSVEQLIDEWVAFCTAGLTCASPANANASRPPRKTVVPQLRGLRERPPNPKNRPIPNAESVHPRKRDAGPHTRLHSHAW